MVSPLCIHSAQLLWPLVFWGRLQIMTSEAGSPPLKWVAISAALCQLWLFKNCFGFCTFSMAGTWPGLGVFDVRKIFWWLDLICSARLVGLLFNTCYYSSFHILVIGSNRVIPASLRILLKFSLPAKIGRGHRATPSHSLVIHMNCSQSCTDINLCTCMLSALVLHCFSFSGPVTWAVN